MTPAEAKETILIHACALDDIFDARQETSFLGSLRPYSGLREENFHEIMQAIKVLTPTLQGEFLDKKIVAALWNICEFSRLWGIDPEGMLRRNNLISPDDVIKLNRWINTISFVIGLILENVSFECVFRSRWPSIPEHPSASQEVLSGVSLGSDAWCLI